MIDIWDAASEGNLKQVDASLKCNADLASEYSCGYTPLYLAARNGHKDIVELLLANKADVNAYVNSETILHAAARNGHKDIVEVLLVNGAEVNGIITYITPLGAAAENGHKDVVELLRQRGGCRYLGGFNKAARVGDVEEVRAMLRANPDLGSSEEAMWWAARDGRKEMVELLLASKADINGGTSKYSMPPLVMATGHKEIVELLLANNANVNAKRVDDGWTALHVAANGGQKDMVALLLANNADVDARDEEGRTPLHCAASPFLTNVSNMHKDIRTYPTNAFR